MLLDMQTVHVGGAPALSKKEVSVRRQAVLDLIKEQATPQTSKEMARLLKVKEVSVRAAIIWLELGGFIEAAGHVTRVYPRGYKKKIALWRWTGRSDPICKLHIKDADAQDREHMKKDYGDRGLALQSVMSLMVSGKERVTDE